jgi:hypothetical protein
MMLVDRLLDFAAAQPCVDQQTIHFADDLAVTLVFSDARLREATIPALNHLRVRPGVAGMAPSLLTLHVVSGAVEGISHFDNSAPQSYFHDENSQAAVETHSRSISAFDAPSSTAVYSIVNPADFPWHERSCPFLKLFHWSLRTHGLQIVHAAAVSTDGKAALLIGSSGSGKSTTALNCAKKGMNLLADDITLVDLRQAALKAYPLYRSVKFENLQDMKSCTDFIDPHSDIAPPGEKHLGFLKELPIEAQLRQLIGVTISTLRKSEARSVSASTVRTGWIKSLTEVLMGAAPADFLSVFKLIKAVPSVELLAGQDKPSSAEVIFQLLNA